MPRFNLAARFAAVLALLVTLVAVAAPLVLQRSADLKNIEDTAEKALTWRYLNADVANALGNIIADLFAYEGAPTPDLADQSARKYQQDRGAVLSLLQQIDALRLNGQAALVIKEARRATVDRLVAGDNLVAQPRAGTPPDAIQAGVGTILGPAALWDKQMSGVDPFISGLVKTQNESQEAAFVQLQVTVEAAVGVSLALLILAAFIVFRTVLAPLRRLSAAATALGRGHDAAIPVRDSRDEVGDLSRALSAWQRSVESRLRTSEATLALNDTIDPEKLLQTGALSLAELTSSAQVSIAVRRRGQLVIDVTRSMPAANAQLASLSERGPGALALTEGRPIIGHLTDTAWYEFWLESPDLAALGPFMAIPMISGGKAIGVVRCLRTATEPEFTALDVESCRSVVASLAAGIHVANIFSELVQTNVAMDEANRHKSEFLARMSHELRTPLNAIIGFSELMLEDLQEQQSNETFAEYLGEISGAGHHLLELINDVLDLAKVESGHSIVRLVATDVDAVIDEVIASVGPLVAVKSQQLVHESPGVGTIRTDARKLRQILINLVSNAIKFSPDGGLIAIRAEATETGIRVAVIDNGVGVAPEDQKRIFEEFQQVAPAGPGTQQGSGLGLALSLRFCRMLGGKIWVESQKFEGSAFYFELPDVGHERAEVAA